LFGNQATANALVADDVTVTSKLYVGTMAVDVQTTVSTLASDIDTVEAAVAVLDGTLSDLDTEIAAVDAAVTVLETSLPDVAADVTAVAADVTDLEGDLSDLSTKVDLIYNVRPTLFKSRHDWGSSYPAYTASAVLGNSGTAVFDAPSFGVLGSGA
jgi:hypothetical protein